MTRNDIIFLIEIYHSQGLKCLSIMSYDFSRESKPSQNILFKEFDQKIWWELRLPIFKSNQLCSKSTYVFHYKQGEFHLQSLNHIGGKKLQHLWELMVMMEFFVYLQNLIFSTISNLCIHFRKSFWQVNSQYFICSVSSNMVSSIDAFVKFIYDTYTPIFNNKIKKNYQRVFPINIFIHYTILNCLKFKRSSFFLTRIRWTFKILQTKYNVFIAGRRRKLRQSI